MNDLGPWLQPAVVIAILLYVWRRLESRLTEVDRRVARLEGLLEGMGLRSSGIPMPAPPGGHRESE